MVTLYSRSEIEQMKKPAAVVKEVFKRLEEYIKPGLTTKDVDIFVEKVINSLSALPSSKNYHGYPAACCTSVNEVVVHGIPGDRVLNDGDIISVDVVVYPQRCLPHFCGGQCRKRCPKAYASYKRSLF